MIVAAHTIHPVYSYLAGLKRTRSGQEVIRLVNRDSVNASAFTFTSNGQRVIADGFHMLQWQLPGENAP